MLKQRIITAAVLVPIVLGLLWFGSITVVKSIFAAILLLAMHEWTKLLLCRKLFQSLALVCYIGIFLFCIYIHLPVSYLIYPAICWWSVAAVLIAISVGLKRSPTDIPLLNHPVFGFISGFFILLPAWFTFVFTFEFSREMILALLFMIWGSDVGAYFAGKYFGKAKLAPNISPGKTWVGVLGGIIVGIFVWVMSTYCLVNIEFFTMHALSMASYLKIVLVMTLPPIVFGVVGDLVESLFKRVAAVKDSGQWLPGHGGVCDRLDSLFAALPIYTFVLGNIVTP